MFPYSYTSKKKQTSGKCKAQELWFKHCDTVLKIPSSSL